MATYLANPLPQALLHYGKELHDVLSRCGAEPKLLPVMSAETQGRGRARVGLATLRERRSALQHVPAGADVVITWPVFGLLDAATWRLPRSVRMSLVVHDPVALRRQVGLGRTAAMLGRLTSSDRRLVVVHSREAELELRARGIRPGAIVPHPMLEPRRAWNCDSSKTVLVLGQYKHARDVPLLAELGPALRRAGFSPEIKGRGWPEDLPGWKVESRFLSERELEVSLRSAAVVLLPYRFFFQSGIAVRAAELGVPVVGPRMSSLELLYGADWPGLLPVDSSVTSWAGAVGEVSMFSATDIEPRTRRAWEQARREWARHYSDGRDVRA